MNCQVQKQFNHIIPAIDIYHSAINSKFNVKLIALDKYMFKHLKLSGIRLKAITKDGSGNIHSIEISHL